MAEKKIAVSAGNESARTKGTRTARKKPTKKKATKPRRVSAPTQRKATKKKAAKKAAQQTVSVGATSSVHLGPLLVGKSDAFIEQLANQTEQRLRDLWWEKGGWPRVFGTHNLAKSLLDPDKPRWGAKRDQVLWDVSDEKWDLDAYRRVFGVLISRGALRERDDGRAQYIPEPPPDPLEGLEGNARKVMEQLLRAKGPVKGQVLANKVACSLRTVQGLFGTSGVLTERGVVNRGAGYELTSFQAQQRNDK